MKKILFLLTSLLAASSAVCFAGCNDTENTDGKTESDNIRTKISTTEDDGNGDACPDCEEHRMPKVHFEFKDGRPSVKEGDDGLEPPERHHKVHPRPPKPPRPAPPKENGQGIKGD